MIRILQSTFIVLMILGGINRADAQYVNIPDINFRIWLMNNGFGTCISGVMMDTTCPAVMNTTKINCSNQNILDLTGIQYFDNLDTLICENNDLVSLPPLKNGLLQLSCGTNDLTALPILPTTLVYLDCNNNVLTALPVLPSGLTFLRCNSNNIATLGTLPATLNQLRCYNNALTALPALPATLTNLDCSHNSILTIPTLPLGLLQMDVGNNNISIIPPLPDDLLSFSCAVNPIASLPTLPDSLGYLYCNGCQLTSLPALPFSLEHVYCHDNQLTSIPSMPPWMIHLKCGNNQITSLPAYNSSLRILDCGNNLLTSLPPNLPANLQQLICSNNFISSLPALPASLYVLTCDSTQITTLPPLPSGLDNLSINYTPITSLPDLPDTLNSFQIKDCQINCLPEIKKIVSFNWTGSSLQCLPNIIQFNSCTPPASGLSLCQPSGNCPTYWNITGNIYKDANSNCVNDAEDELKYVPLLLDSSGITLQEMLTDVEGNYSFRAYYGTYNVRIDTTGLPYTVNCPLSNSHVSVLTPGASHDSLADFGLQCKPGHDLKANSISTSAMFRPGVQRTVFLNAGDAATLYGTNCNTGLAGTVQAVLTGPATYVSAAPGALTPTSVIGNTITWNVADFSLSNPSLDYNFITSTPTSAGIGDTVCLDLTIGPLTGDNNQLNNVTVTCLPVVNSFDPNEKHMSPSGAVDTSQQWFTFTIFFQNTGNAPAEDIFITDTLSNTLEATSFIFLSSSHEVITQLLPGSVLRFNYPDINLPDSTSNEPASHGYVSFRMKRKQGLPVGTVITNTSNIFFDYNPPVITNTVSATLTLPLSISESTPDVITVFPNPTDGIFQFTGNYQQWNSVELYDVLGNVVYKKLQGPENEYSTIDISHLENGIYFIRVNTDGGSTTGKILKSGSGWR